jgi:hypothetical protein
VVPSIGSSLLAATMFLGQQATDAQVIPQPGSKITYNNTGAPATPTTQTPAPSRPILGWFQREDRPILSKMQGWFRKDPQEPPLQNIPPRGTGTEKFPTVAPSTPTLPSTPTTTDYPKKMPSTSNSSPAPTEVPMIPAKPLQQSSMQVQPNTKQSPILPQLANKIGRDEKFAWITGQLEIENGTYVLYYATPDTVDKYHGRIVLQAPQSGLSQFRKGDLISVRGDVSQRTGLQGGPVYRVTDATLIDRLKSL